MKCRIALLHHSCVSGGLHFSPRLISPEAFLRKSLQSLADFRSAANFTRGDDAEPQELPQLRPGPMPAVFIATGARREIIIRGICPASSSLNYVVNFPVSGGSSLRQGIIVRELLQSARLVSAATKLRPCFHGLAPDSAFSLDCDFVTSCGDANRSAPVTYAFWCSWPTLFWLFSSWPRK